MIGGGSTGRAFTAKSAAAAGPAISAARPRVANESFFMAPPLFTFLLRVFYTRFASESVAYPPQSPTIERELGTQRYSGKPPRVTLISFDDLYCRQRRNSVRTVSG